MLKLKIKQVVLPATRDEDPGGKPTAAQLAETVAILICTFGQRYLLVQMTWRDVSPAIYLQWFMLDYMCEK